MSFTIPVKKNDPNKNKVIEILNNLSELQCKILFGESERFQEWLKENGVEDNVSKIMILS